MQNGGPMTTNDRSKRSKISAGLAARLEQMGPKDNLRVIVMLRIPAPGKGGRRRTSSEDRDAAVQAVKESAGTAFSEVDDILERFGGRRLADSPDAFGAVPVKATAPAIYALARSRKVKAILEDQSVQLAS